MYRSKPPTVNTAIPQGAPGPTTPYGKGRSPEPPHRLLELFDSLKREVEMVAKEAAIYKAQKEELEMKITAQYHEMTAFQQTLYDFERVHTRMKNSYEEEIQKLRKELEQRGIPVPKKVDNRPPPTPSAPAMAPPPSPKQKTTTGILSLNECLESVEGDWTVYHNPKAKKKLSVALNHTFDHSSVVCCVRFSNDGKYLATGCNHSAQIFDITTGEKIASFDQGSAGEDLYIRSVCFSPDNQYLATGAEDKTIRIWDIKSQTCKAEMKGHEQDIYSLDWRNDVIVSGSGDQTAKLWDSQGNLLMTFVEKEPVQGKEGGVTSVNIHPSGKAVVTGSLDEVIRIWDIKTGAVLERFQGHKDSVYSVSFSTDGHHIVSGALDRSIKVWKVSDATLKHLVQPSPIHTVNTTHWVHSFVGHTDFVLSVNFPCSLDVVISGSKDRNVTIWDLQPQQDPHAVPIMTLQGHKNSVISISTFDKYLLTGSGDCKAKLWKLSLE